MNQTVTMKCLFLNPIPALEPQPAILIVHSTIHQFHNNPWESTIKYHFYYLEQILDFYQIHIRRNQNLNQEKGKVFIPIIYYILIISILLWPKIIIRFFFFFTEKIKTKWHLCAMWGKTSLRKIHGHGKNMEKNPLKGLHIQGFYALNTLNLHICLLFHIKNNNFVT